MRKILILSTLALATAGGAGCTRNPCGEGWRPGYYLFGVGRQPKAPQGTVFGYNECCDPCGGGGAVSGGAMMMDGAIMSAPPAAAAPCCQ